MSLSSDLISQFVKVNKEDKTEKKESTVNGTTVEYNGSTYVKLDGSDLLTPISTTTDTKPGERVTVLIKNHTATVTGNISSPAARTDDVKELGTKITEFDVVMAYKVTTEDLTAINANINNLKAKLASFDNMEAINAEIENLRAKLVDADRISASELEAITADIETLRAKFGDFTDISTDDLEAINADIDNLKAYVGDFTYVSTDVLKALKAEIESADLKYANIDFSNIGQAAMEYFYANSGLIEDVIINEGSITGNLVGVTIKGDRIEGNTIVADKLVIKGEDGLYYKLNTSVDGVDVEQASQDTLDGTVLTAKSITAEKVNVSDLVAFDATIGGFNITSTSIYSEVKDSEDNTTRGIYLDTDGQVNIGDANNFIKYYVDEDGTYKLAISAASIMYALDGSQYSVEDLAAISEYVHIGTYEDEPCLKLGEDDSDFQAIITNTRILFFDGSIIPAYISNQALNIEKAVIKDELQIGGFVWKKRTNGNVALMWKGES